MTLSSISNKWKCAGAVVLVLLAMGTGFPIPLLNGPRLNPQFGTYRRNLRGIYYISVDHPLQLIEVGTYGYLRGAATDSFVVLSNNWAKDSGHVWHGDDMVEEADAASFRIDKSGLAKDRNNVFVYDAQSDAYRPMHADIDVATAEYFVQKGDGQDWIWIRDKDRVWLDETEVQVDRNTFRPLGHSNWWVDKSWVYADYWDADSRRVVLATVDTLHAPIDTLVAGSTYLRNGRNIIYLDKVVAKDIEVRRFKDVGVSKCVVNDMLFEDGRQILKDSLDVSKAKFYFYGHIATDGRHVFYSHTLLGYVDAATFRQTGEDTFEDRNYRYTIKNNAWKEKDPFDKEWKK